MFRCCVPWLRPLFASELRLKCRSGLRLGWIRGASRLCLVLRPGLRPMSRSGIKSSGCVWVTFRQCVPRSYPGFHPRMHPMMRLNLNRRVGYGLRLGHISASHPGVASVFLSLDCILNLHSWVASRGCDSFSFWLSFGVRSRVCVHGFRPVLASRLCAPWTRQNFLLSESRG